VRLETRNGVIVLDRPDGSLATLSMAGQPDRAVALKRRETAELLAEELRRLDPDNIYEATVKFGVERLGGPTEPSSVGSGQKRPEPAGSAAPAAKKAAAKKAASK
jgi:hypothetical protein